MSYMIAILVRGSVKKKPKTKIFKSKILNCSRKKIEIIIGEKLVHFKEDVIRKEMKA